MVSAVLPFKSYVVSQIGADSAQPRFMPGEVPISSGELLECRCCLAWFGQRVSWNSLKAGGVDVLRLQTNTIAVGKKMCESTTRALRTVVPCLRKNFSYSIELATDENTLLALEPMSRSAPTAIARTTASMMAYSATSWPASSSHNLCQISIIFDLAANEVSGEGPPQGRTTYPHLFRVAGTSTKAEPTEILMNLI
jgi:hypothetical protein